MPIAWLARIAFFLSGVAGLTFEIVWMRHLGLALGATTLAVATTTAAYMGGLALGSYLGGQVADRMRRPLSWYGALEVGIAVAGLGIPLACRHLTSVDALFLHDLESAPVRGLVRFAVAAAVLALPTTAMGMTLPILARALTQSVTEVGRQVGGLYALNIVGAMVGAACAGFWWIPALGLSATNRVAVGIDLVLGGVALVAGLAVSARREPMLDASPPLRPGTHGLVAMLAVTGAAAMALQVLWTRALGTALGPSTYAFTAIVCAYLAGLALGSAGAAWWADRVREPRLALATVLLGTGVAAFGGVLLVDDLPALLRPIVVDPALTKGALLRTEFVLAAITVLPATVGMGAIFPLTLTAVTASADRVGGAVGRAYAINTVGAIVGSAAAVFVLLPAFGVEWGMRVAVLAYLVAGASLAWRTLAGRAARLRGGLLAFGAVALLLVAVWPSWDVARWTAGLFRLSFARTYFTEKMDLSEVVFHKDGLAATVTVEEEQGVRWIKVDGKIDGSSEGDMPTQTLSGLLPMVLHPEPDRVAVIGCGSCVTVGAVLRAGAKDATLIELEPAVLEAAVWFEEVNGAPWKDPRLRIVEDDGRNMLMRDQAPYDLIISEPSNPWMTGAASLFTQELFRIAQARLTDDGMFLQWLQIYELAPERIASILKTFQSVFPHVLVFSAHVDSNDLLLVGTRAPLTFDLTRQRRLLLELDGLFAQADVESEWELLSRLLLDEQAFASFTGPAQLNTDDNALIEFGAPLDLLTYAEDDPELPIFEDTRPQRAAVVWRHLPPQERRPETLEKLAEGYLRQGLVTEAEGAADMLAQVESEERAGVVRGLIDALDGPDRAPVADEAVLAADADYARVVAAMRGDQGTQGALRMYEAQPELDARGFAHTLLHGFLLYREERHERAEAVLQAAAALAPDEAGRATASYYLAKNAFVGGSYREAYDIMSPLERRRLVSVP